MYCPPGAQVSWVLQKQLSVLWTQRTKSSATSHGRTSVCNTEHEIRQWYLAHKYLQALIGRYCWMVFGKPSLPVCANTYKGFHTNGRKGGLVRWSSSVLPRIYGEIAEDGMWPHPSSLKKRYWMFGEPATLWHNYTLRFVLAADFQLSLFLVADRQYT